MTPFTFAPATREQARLRLALLGPGGSGKTYTGLLLATALGDRVAVIDTEHGKSRLYADEFRFDVLELETFSPETYIQAIEAADDAGYDCLLIDSLSHAWSGKGGALEMVDAAAKRNSGNSFAGWRDVTPLHNRLIDTMLGTRLHLIATLRSKVEYVLEEDSRGKKVPKRVGLAPVQRDGLEYEFDLMGELDLDNRLTITKSRSKALRGAVIERPGLDLAATIRQWLEAGEPDALTAATRDGLKVDDLRRLRSTDQARTFVTGLDDAARERVKALTPREFRAFWNDATLDDWIEVLVVLRREQIRQDDGRPAAASSSQAPEDGEGTSSSSSGSNGQPEQARLSA